jgi:hypothetical protein
MTPYTFAKNARTLVLIFSVGVLIFFVGAISTGYKPNLSNWIAIILACLNIIAYTFNKPKTSNEQTARETTDTKQN